MLLLKQMVQFTSFSSYITKEQGSITEVAEDDLATSTIQGVTYVENI